MNVSNKYKRYEREILLAIAVIFFVTGFLTINAFTKERAVHIPVHTLTTSIDNMIPFVPIFMITYLSAFIMPVSAYIIVKDLKRYRATVKAFLATMATAFAIFLLYPVEVVIRINDPQTIFAKLFHLYYTIDLPYNAFPSLHVALPLLAGIAAIETHRRYWWVLVWALLIALSTMLTKIHYVVDVIAGFTIAIFYYWLFVVRK